MSLFRVKQSQDNAVALFGKRVLHQVLHRVVVRMHSLVRMQEISA